MRQISPIKAARIKLGLTQAALGQAVGVTKASVCGWERGHNLPDTHRLADLAAALAPHFDLPAYLESVKRSEAA